MELVYNIKDKPPFPKALATAFQQVLAILAGTIAVPMVVGNGMSQSAALFGAGVGTIIYLIFTKFRSPVFLGSSFSFVGSMLAAFAGAASMAISGYVGLILGALLCGIFYSILSLIIHFAGTDWISKVMPPVIIGPTVAIIGLTLSPNAINNILKGGVLNIEGVSVANPYICLACGLVCLITAVIVSTYTKGLLKLIPFLIGIGAGYLVALLFTGISYWTDNEVFRVINLDTFKTITWVPDFAFIHAFEDFGKFESVGQFFSYFGVIAVAYVPVAFVTFAEHIADHKNLSFITGSNLLEDPGLSRTLLGDGIGSFAGAFCGGCPNTTYGESISCVALSKIASTFVILLSSIIAIIASFVGPLMSFFESIPPCIVGGLCIALYGFIAASGFQMLKSVDMSDTKNIFIVASILVVGVGGLAIQISEIQFSPVATAMMVGILINAIVSIRRKKHKLDK